MKGCIKTFLIFFLAGIIPLLAGSLGQPKAFADIKWSQPPDMKYGVNIKSTELEPIVADDWRCTDPRPVTDVHFWGSFIKWHERIQNPTGKPPGIDGFLIRIYKDIPAGTDPDIPYSRPGEVLYEAEVKEFLQEYVAAIFLPNGTYEHKFYYCLDLPTPFDQEEGTIYWISVSANMAEPDIPFPWGWETSTRHWNDNAARFWFHNNYWEEIKPAEMPGWYQKVYDTVDMAFELSVPDKEPPELVKWRQRPDMTHGINVASAPYLEQFDLPSVADDWRCLAGSPVADLHFWGSYLGWFDLNQTPQMPPPGVDKFRIQIYSDRPATSADDYSRPDKLLYETWTDEFTETYVEAIPVTWPPGAEFEHKFRYDLDLPRIFWQKPDRVYWLNIAAVPKDMEYPWGWESSMDRWNDKAVRGFYNSPDDYSWQRIFNPMIRDYVDMSFILTACKGPIKWLQFPDMDEGRNIIALEPKRIVADDWLCREGKPVTEVRFWGSYLDTSGQEHWEQNNPGQPNAPLPTSPGVQQFRLSFHKDVPAGTDPRMPWSHPGELIREDFYDENQVTEHYWDSIPHTDVTGTVWYEHKFYYRIKLDQPFLQEAGNIYWLDISAVPAGEWLWGWETSMDHWNDSAVIRKGSGWMTLGAWGTGFEDLSLGTVYNPGNAIVTNGLSIGVRPFAAGTSGNVTVNNLGGAGGSGNELEVRVANLNFDFSSSGVEDLSLLFGELGGTYYIEVNGSGQYFNTFADINGHVIGGVQVEVVYTGTNMGTLTLKGVMTKFVIGGQELNIDTIKTKSVDMAFLLIAEDDIDYCEGDFDRDGDVDGLDLSVMGPDMNRTDCFMKGDCEGDFTYDGDVDEEDLKVFADDFGRTDCPCDIPSGLSIGPEAK